MGEADLLAFVGRFHVLAVHLPIGLIVLAGAVEAATLSSRLRPRLDPVLGVLLAAALAAAGVAFWPGVGPRP